MNLAKCSFCGSIPQVVSDPVSTGYKEFYLSTYILCTSCLTRGPAFPEFHFPSAPKRVRLASLAWNKVHDREEATR